MKKKANLVVVLIVAISALGVYGVVDAQRKGFSDKSLTEGYIVKLKDNVTEVQKNEIVKEKGLDKFKGNNIEGSRLIKVESDKSIDPIYIDKVEQNGLLELQNQKGNDPLAAEQWYLEAIGFNSDLAIKKSSSTKIIAVIDSGVCFSHPDLKKRIMKGWNFIDNNSDVTDSNGHGCMVSGVMGANTKNSIGIAGASNDVLIMPLKIIDSNGSGDYINLINAINYAVKNKVDIINISLGGVVDSEILKETIENAVNKGVKVIASAGNTSNEVILYPAKYDRVISVGSVENDYTISEFSSKSPEVNLWAYGNGVLTTNINNDYSRSTGTSIATALASAFLIEGGEFNKGSIINFQTNNIYPIFKDKLIEFKEPISGLNFNVPEDLQVDGFGNVNPSDYVINWQKVVNIASGEAVAISVWNRESSDEISNLFENIVKMDGCSLKSPEDECLLKDPDPSNSDNLVAYVKYKINGKSLVRVMYSFRNLVGINIYLDILKSINLQNEVLFEKSNLEVLFAKVTTKVYPQGATSCGGLSDTGNPYDCCSTSNPGQNNANCTWYAAYKRPDLKGIITLWPEGLWNQVVQAGIPTSQTPQLGALIVWELHVAYVESFTETSVTWSEQNCYNSNNPFNASVTRNGHSPLYSAGNFLGYILQQGGNGSCGGADVSLSNWNVNGPLSCSATNSITINSESTIQSTGGTVNLHIQ